LTREILTRKWTKWYKNELRFCCAVLIILLEKDGLGRMSMLVLSREQRCCVIGRFNRKLDIFIELKVRQNFTVCIL
jgi:hypothetical protein